jgi:hypothetical protein
VVENLRSWTLDKFGIASAPASWQRAMDQILQGLSGVQCVLDDMIITGKSDDEHLQNLENVLQRLQDNGLRANIEKCSFLQDSVVYCGHEISKEGLQKTKDKVEAVVNTPVPKNTTQLRALLGLVNYYHKFLPNLATEIRPLNELLEKDRKWVWNERCNRAFLKVKDMITSDVVLTHYDPNLPVRLACDASPYGSSVSIIPCNDRWNRKARGICITFFNEIRAELCPN